MLGADDRDVIGGGLRAAPAATGEQQTCEQQREEFAEMLHEELFR